MSDHDARRLLARIGALRRPCDLDLLVFFARHPRTLLTSEQIAKWLGYELKQIAEALDLLISAGLLTRVQNPTHAARMYVFAAEDTPGGWLPALLAMASTRQGRLKLLEALTPQGPAESGPADRARGAADPPAPGVVVPWPDKQDRLRTG